MAAPANCGKRLIPQILDSLAASDPERIIYSIAKSADISQGFRDISARDFAKAVDKTAWWLHNEVGKGTSCDSVGYIGPHDLRHILLTYASVKAGYSALFLSPKNSTEGALAVLEAAKCNIWIQPIDTATPSNAQSFLEQRPMKILRLPELNDLLDSEGTEPYLYDKTWDEAAKDPFCILHTSGSTGLPKPIVWSHALIGTMDAVRLLPPAEGDQGMAPWTKDWNEGDRIYSAFPMSHGAGIIMDIIIPSLFAMPCVLGPVGVIPNTNLLESLAEHGKIDIWSIVPSLVDELGETPDVLAKFKSSKFICASGGPVSPVSASKVNKVVRVLNLTGTTEGLFIGNLWVDREDWLYFSFHPYSGFQFREVEPGVYEHWVVRNHHWELFQGIFTTFPELEELNFKDLYTKHPTKPDHWAYKGRSDDVVVLSNGYKISPLETESFISTHPDIDGCLVVGSGKPQAALLIELKDPSSKSDELVDSIWAIIEKANSMSLHKDQIQRDYITFSDPEKPFIRTDKGTIKRRATLILYNDHIDNFYASREEEIDPGLSIKVDIGSIESIENAVRHILGSLNPTFQAITSETDLFDLGLDSLLVYRAIRSFRVIMGLQDQIGPRHLYANPTVGKFSAALAKIAAAVKSGNAADATLDDKSAKVKELLQKYDSRESSTLTGFDGMLPKVYIQMMLYLPLREGVSFEETFASLQRGFSRTVELLPALNGQVTLYEEHEPGYVPGKLHIKIPDKGQKDSSPRQLVYRDLSDKLPSFQELRDSGFVSLGCSDELVMELPFWWTNGADIVRAQANFIKGGCLIATAFHHTCFDGTGVVTALSGWAENCRFVEGDASATCSWLDPDSMNRMLPHALWEQEGYARPVEEIDPNTWTYLCTPPPEDVGKTLTCPESRIEVKRLPIPPPERVLEPVNFSISAENLEQLIQDVASELGSRNAVTEADIVQGLFWRAVMKARIRTAEETQGKTFAPDDVSILEFPFDIRPYFSSSLPSSYMGNALVFLRSAITVEKLMEPKTNAAHVASLIREAAGKIRPSLVHDSFALLKTTEDYDEYKFAFIGYESLNLLVTNLMLLPMSTMAFGGKFFGNGGAPDTMIPLTEGLNGTFRICIILPQRPDGGLTIRFGALPEELQRVKEDEELSKYATFLG